MNHPILVLHPWALVAATVAAFIFGGMWYGPLFGKKWAKLMGMPGDCKPDPKLMRRAFSLQLVGTFLAVFVLAHIDQIHRPSVWGLSEPEGPNYMYGFFNGFFIWLGFYIPLQLGKVSWENKPWKLFFINAGHDFFNLQIMAQIIAHWR